MDYDNLFMDLGAKFYWSEGDILDRNGNPYPEGKKFSGKDAYDFLAAVVSKDKEQHNNKILGRGYQKTRLEISYKGNVFGNFRVDLGDMEFGLHNNVAESLRTRLGLILKSDDRYNDEDIKGFNELMDKFAKEEAEYLPHNRDLQKRLNTQPMTYLYAYTPKAWDAMPEMIHNFYKPRELSDEEKKYLFPDGSDSNYFIVESSRRPQSQMKEYGETTCKLLIPQKEKEMLDFFERSFRLESRHTYCFGDFYDFETSGFAALEQINSCMDADFMDFCSYTSANYYAPDQRWYLNVSFRGEEIGTISYEQGSGDCILAGARMFSDYCKEDPEFVEHLKIACKYNSDKTYHLDNLIDGLSYADKQRLDHPIPDKETSLQTLSELKPEVPDINSCGYSVSKYFDHIKKVALLKLSDDSWEPLPAYITREMANDNLNLRTVKSMMKNVLSNFALDQIVDAYKTDKETKKILKMRKTLNTAR